MNLVTRTTVSALLVASALLFGSVSPAGAQDCSASSPTQDQYCPPSTITFEESDPSPSGGLPFTGYDVGLAALAAAVLIGAGFTLRRAARAEEAQ